MVRAWSAASEALEKMSSSTKTAFRASSFCSPSTLAPSSPRFPIAALHRSPDAAAAGAPDDDEGDGDPEAAAAPGAGATAAADFSLCAAMMIPAAVPPSVLLPRRSMSSPLRFQDAPRLSLLRVKASSDDTSAASGDELIADLKAKWDAVENKSTVVTYAGGAVVALWLTSVIVGAVNSVPLLPKIMELVGLGYTGWFIYRYLLFKESRKELADDIESLKKRIAGTE